MRILIVEDEFICRKILQDMLYPYGVCDIAVNGNEAVMAFKHAHDNGEPYSLICMDIKMPEMDGNDALKTIRKYEADLKISPSNEVKIIMTTALDTPKEVINSYFEGGCTGYVVKPVEPKIFKATLAEYGFYPPKAH